jgi:hypothetical protein
MAKAYWVNSVERTVTEVECNSLEDMRRYVGGHIELAHVTDQGDTLYVDEEGLMKYDHGFLYYHRQDQMLLGNGLLVGPEVEGDQYPNGYTTLSPFMTLKGFKFKVVFP